jgi:hypothetical protein
VSRVVNSIDSLDQIFRSCLYSSTVQLQAGGGAVWYGTDSERGQYGRSLVRTASMVPDITLDFFCFNHVCNTQKSATNPSASWGFSLYVRFWCQVEVIGGEKREKNTFYYVSIPAYLNH